MSRTKSKLVRRGFTLIEMLVVMAIIALVASIGYMAFPNMSNRAMTDAGDRLQGWLLTAKQIARRDGRNTGLRFQVVAAGSNYVNTVHYVQQPDDFVGSATALCTCTGNTTVTFAPAEAIGTGVDKALVQQGDHICFSSSGVVYPIANQPPNNMTRLTLGLAGPNFNGNHVPYRIIRQPRRLLGEDDLLLPGNTQGQPVDPNNSTLIDMSKSGPTALTARTGITPTTYEILFAPSGAVVGSNSDIVSLWVCNQNNTVPPVLVTIRTRTGLIGVNPVSSAGADPYAFTRDGRASGM